MKLEKIKFYNKKGMFFTLIAISLISLFLVAYATYYFVEDRKALNKRVVSMDNFVFSLEDDLSRQLYISGYRTIFLLEKRISDTGQPISNVSLAFSEAFYNQSLYGENQDLMIGATLSDIRTTIDERASKINVRVILSPESVKLVQEDPWRIKVSMQAQLFVEDKGGLASWNLTKEFFSFININNFEDPLYALNTGGRIIKKINSTIYSGFIFWSDISNFSKQLELGLYTNSSLAPSFIDRMEGRNAPNINGIESFVYLPQLSAQDIIVQDKSCVDYIYFSSYNPLAYSLSGMPSWFKLDDPHINMYGAGGLKI
jgi:hypothetical protein